MAETTVNESTEQRIGTNSGGKLVFSGPEVVPDFATRTSQQLAGLLDVINESTSDACFIKDAMTLAQDLAWQLQQAIELMADSLSAQPIRAASLASDAPNRHQ